MLKHNLREGIKCKGACTYLSICEYGITPIVIKSSQTFGGFAPDPLKTPLFLTHLNTAPVFYGGTQIITLFFLSRDTDACDLNGDFPRTFLPPRQFPLLFTRCRTSPFHHHHPLVYNIKRSTVNMYKIDGGRSSVKVFKFSL